MQVNIHRAYLGTVAAEAAGIAHVYIFAIAAQEWRYHRANGAGIGSGVGVAPNVFIHRAGIEAGAAADTGKRFALGYLAHKVGAAIVQQYHIHFFRAVFFIFFARAGDYGIVIGKPLPGAKRR